MTNAIACTLTPDEFRSRRNALLPGLAARATRREMVEDGVRLYFEPRTADDIVSAIAAVLEAERRCCKFLSFTLAVDANDGPISLTIVAPPEAQSTLTELLGEQH